jgi:cation transport protein ChaC
MESRSKSEPLGESICDTGPESAQDIWIFGYGSLIWRPDFNYLERQIAAVEGWTRRFWQGSHDHRGTPNQPGRVVTLTRDAAQSCTGIAYRLSAETAHTIFAALDHREKNGYERLELCATTPDKRQLNTITYVATPNNFAYLGPASLNDISQQIASCVGPSGPNTEYLFELAQALRELKVDDAHVFELEQQVREHLP